MPKKNQQTDREDMTKTGNGISDDKFKDWTDDDKLQIIDGMSELKSVPMGCRPQCCDENQDYYFISYSHKDFKKVFHDVFALQKKGLAVWYDREMVYGRSWLEIAEKYIRNQHCLGVVFYVSEKSVVSEAICEEIKFAQKFDKGWCTVNLPLEDKDKVGAENVGDELSAKAILDILKNNGSPVDDNVYNFISKTLDESVLFVEYSSGIDYKIEKIRSITTKPLFEFNREFITCYITAVNNVDIKTVKNSDFNVCDRDVDIAINPCVFANCKYLEKIDLPENLVGIGEYAFFRCTNLKQIDVVSRLRYVSNFAFCECVNLKSVTGLKNTYLQSIAKGSFAICEKLTEIILPNNIESIGDYAFDGCSSLREINLDSVESIGDFAFSGCSNLTGIDLNSVKSISNYAFRSCISLTEINFDSVKSIGDVAFLGCNNLTEIYLGSVKSIGNFAFNSCSNLSCVTFGGKMEDWAGIELGHGVFSGTQVKAVHCSDGDIILDGE